MLEPTKEVIIQKKQSIFVVFVNALVLCFMAFYNRFPLVFSDTGTYIRSGFKLEVPLDRPIFYGLFVRASSLGESLYLTVFVQGLLVATAIHLLFKYYVNHSKRLFFETLFVLLITFFTGASLTVSQLIPDVFTPITIIAFLLLVLQPNLTKIDRVISYSLLGVSLVCHNAHFVIVGGVLAVVSVWFFVPFFKEKIEGLKLNRIVWLWVFLMFCNVSARITHKTLGGSFSASPGGHVFLMARLLDLKIAQDYLNENCATNQYEICQYKDNLPWDFLWNWESPSYKTGGWDANKEEYTNIALGALTTPKYFLRFFIRTIESGMAQFFCFETGGTPVLREDSAPYFEVNNYFNSNLKEYITSRQATNFLNHDFVNDWQKVLFVLSLAFVFCIFYSSAKLDSLPVFSMLLIGMLVMNAFVSGGLSVVSERYQSRVFFLLLFPMVFYLVNTDWKLRFGITK